VWIEKTLKPVPNHLFWKGPNTCMQIPTPNCYRPMLVGLVFFSISIGSGTQKIHFFTYTRYQVLRFSNFLGPLLVDYSNIIITTIIILAKPYIRGSGSPLMQWYATI